MKRAYFDGIPVTMKAEEHEQMIKRFDPRNEEDGPECPLCRNYCCRVLLPSRPERKICPLRVIGGCFRWLPIVLNLDEFTDLEISVGNTVTARTETGLNQITKIHEHLLNDWEDVKNA